MNTPAAYFHWQFILISYPNLFLIIGMIGLFVGALLAPFPGRRGEGE